MTYTLGHWRPLLECWIFLLCTKKMLSCLWPYLASLWGRGRVLTPFSSIYLGVAESAAYKEDDGWICGFLLQLKDVHHWKRGEIEQGTDPWAGQGEVSYRKCGHSAGPGLSYHCGSPVTDHCVRDVCAWLPSTGDTVPLWKLHLSDSSWQTWPCEQMCALSSPSLVWKNPQVHHKPDGNWSARMRRETRPNSRGGLETRMSEWPVLGCDLQ